MERLFAPQKLFKNRYFDLTRLITLKGANRKGATSTEKLVRVYLEESTTE